MLIKLIKKTGAILKTSGKYCRDDIEVRVNSDNIEPENIKEGIEILGVTGTYKPVINLDSKSVMPSTSAQTIKASDANLDGFNEVTVEAVTSSIDSDIQPENIKEGVEILGVTGTFKGGISGMPIEVSTVEEMTTILTNATSEDVGKFYKYTGESTIDYINGELYMISEVA